MSEEACDRACIRCEERERRKVSTGWFFPVRMVVCATCGNKRCPHATDHRLACSGSNDPGQAGSVY